MFSEWWGNENAMKIFQNAKWNNRWVYLISWWNIQCETVLLVHEKLIQAFVWTVIKVWSIFCTNTNNEAFPVLSMVLLYYNQ